jgi:hypothetical protein
MESRTGQTDWLAIYGLTWTLGLYVWSFFLPAYQYPDGRALPGLCGFLGAAAGAFAFCASFGSSGGHTWLFFLGWLANPLLWAAVGYSLGRRWRRALLASAAAVYCGSVWLLYREVELREGYYAWLASAGVLAWTTAWRSFQPEPL